jgi:competence protein ComEC
MVIIGQFSLLLAYPLALINNSLLTFILYVTKISSELPFAIVKVATPGKIVVICYYLGVFFFLWYKPKYKPELKIKFKSVAVVAMVISFVLCLYNLIPGKLEVVFVDVGQGDCTFIKSSAGKTVLIDGGGTEGKDDNDNNIGESTVIPFLYDYGVSKVDMVIATHGHQDHIQGLIPVLKNMKVGKLIIPDSPDDKGLRKIIKIVDDLTRFEVMHPYKGFEIDKSSINNCSLVLKLSYKKTNMIFTGDIEKEVEDLLFKENVDLKADVIKIAHHGSPNSTTAEFLDYIKPAAAIISVGKNNFGHPDKVVLDRMKVRGIKLYRTDQCGALILKSDGNKITVKRTIGE